jgi:hypothetical protein
MVQSNDESAASYPQLQKIQSSLYRAKNKLLPPAPQSRETFVLDGEWRLTEDKQRNFVLFDNGYENRIIGFATTENLT